MNKKTTFEIKKSLIVSENLINDKLIDEKIKNEKKIKYLKEIARHYRNLYTAARVINSSIKINEALHTTINILANVLHAKTISIMLIDTVTNELVVQAAKHSKDIVGVRKNMGEGISGKVALTGRPIIMPELNKETIKSYQNKLDAFMSIPLKHEDTVIGVINVTHKMNGGFFTERDQKIILEMSKQIATAIANANLYSTIEILALQDGLTKLYNRNFFQKNLTEEIKKAKIQNYFVSIIMLDVDFFKSINDTYGHPVGDEVLKKIAAILKSSVRKTDIAARYGGEEMIGILLGANSEEGLSVAEKVRTRIQDLELFSIQSQILSEDKNIVFEKTPEQTIDILLYPFNSGEGLFLSKEACQEELQKLCTLHKDFETIQMPNWKIIRVKVSVSIGIASYPEDIQFSSKGFAILESTNEQDLLLYMADKALYRAKKNGRNRTLTYQSVQQETMNYKKEVALNTIQTVMNQLDQKDHQTYLHALRVGKICEIIARHLQIRKEERLIAKYAGTLHDVGKIFIDNAILLKPDKLTNDEYTHIKKHPEEGANLLESYPILHRFINGVRHHHERLDGSGYPDHLSGTRIPIEARIIGVADSYDAMVSVRPYTDLTHRIDSEHAIEEIQKKVNLLYDKEVVDAFVSSIEEIRALNQWQPVLD